MTDQPDMVPDESQGTKSCWVCSTPIPYAKGWCLDCWVRMGDERQKIALYAQAVPDHQFQGNIFMAITTSLKRELAPPPEAKKPPVAKSKADAKTFLDNLEVKYKP